MSMKKNFSELFQTWLSEYFHNSSQNKNFVELLYKSQEYSLQTGGKRFRPYLATLIFKIWQNDLDLIKNFCLAIEMVHTYSLIHDDLPCMDNDDLRRGKPTSHKVFGEDIALLAGDSLLTEAFHLISAEKKISAQTRVEVIESFSEKIGSLGMVGGQVLDMKSTKQVTFEQLEQIHYMKTGCLIQAAATGAAQIAGASADEVQLVAELSMHLGMAFQIKDDLLDIKDNEQDFKNYVSVIGVEKTQQQLSLHSEKALVLLKSLKNNSESLQELQNLILENQKRTI